MKKLLAIVLLVVGAVAAGYGLGQHAVLSPVTSAAQAANGKQDFEKRFDSYSATQKAQIRESNKAVFARLSNPGEFEKAAALNHYIYNDIARARNATANSALEVLSNRTAICGGMVMALAEMLYAEGIQSSLAYVRGGKGAAHSMLRVSFSDGERGLFDPYHGVLYYDAEAKKPVGMRGVKEQIAAGKRPVFYADKIGAANYRGFAQNYTTNDTLNRIDYQFPDIFTDATGAGIANSGFIDVVNIRLTPGVVLGVRGWQPSEHEPQPWTRLAQWREGDEYMSWAYMLGQSAMGYDIRHAYQLSGLVPGTRYTLKLDVANAYARLHGNGIPPALSINQVYPAPRNATSGSHQFLLEQKGYVKGKPYLPQTVEVEFTADMPDKVFFAAPNANLTLSALSLEAL